MFVRRITHRLAGIAGVSVASLAALTCLASAASAQIIDVESGKPHGVYAVGEKIVWHIKVSGDGADGVTKIHYVLKEGQLKKTGEGDVTVTNGAADLETSMDHPGSMLAFLTIPVADKDQPLHDLAGALVAPYQIAPSMPRPADFDSWWRSKVDELHKVPVNAVLTPADGGRSGVDYEKIMMDNIRGTHIQGQIARPATGDKFPAILHVQWAGVYPLQKGWVTNDAANGWLSLNILAHDLPIDQTPEFYTDVTKNQFHGDYSRIGNTDRETDYFLRMYLSCYRAIEYLKSRPDWDGKTLVVTGGSQGGLQTLMVGGLYPGALTALIAEVPAGCDQTGPLVDREAGWPVRYWPDSERKRPEVVNTIRYYDVVNFASRIHCPTLVATGLIDQTCPDHGVLAAYNQIPAPKKLIIMERAEHTDPRNKGTHTPFYVESGKWLAALKNGQAPPVEGK